MESPSIEVLRPTVKVVRVDSINAPLDDLFAEAIIDHEGQGYRLESWQYAPIKTQLGNLTVVPAEAIVAIFRRADHPGDNRLSTCRKCGALFAGKPLCPFGGTCEPRNLEP